MTNQLHVQLEKTNHPCPVWCVLPAGHGFEGIDYETQVRFHSRTIPQSVLVGGCGGPGDKPAYRMAPELSAMETATLDGSRVLTQTPAAVTLGIDDDTLMNSTQLRQVAAALLDVADLYDEIVQASRS